MLISVNLHDVDSEVVVHFAVCFAVSVQKVRTAFLTCRLSLSQG